jgi:tetratricopeptide (TPR) repeat protein
MSHWKDHPIFGEYLIQLLHCSHCFPELDLNYHIPLGTEHFKSKDPLEQGKTQSLSFSSPNYSSPARWYRALGIYFWGAKLDSVEDLKYYQRAYSLAESVGYPTPVGFRCLASICGNLINTGEPLNALTYAKEAYRYAGHIGNMYGQAWSLWLQGMCHIHLASYWHAQHLLQTSGHILAALGQQYSSLDISIIGQKAEIHLMKSEYLQSHNLQVTIVSSCQPTSSHAILANLNIVFIDIATGADSKIIHQNLDMAQSHLKALCGYIGRRTCLFHGFVTAQLCLRDGALGTANAIFEKCLASSLDIVSTELALLCLERLGDLSTAMNDIQTTLQWAGIFLGLALKCKYKHQTMHAFRCLGQIFSAEGDVETALSLFNVALDGFTFMDVHRWRADCMVCIADIVNNHGEVMKAVNLWKAARPLFEQSSQMQDITRIDAKLAEIDSAILAKYEEQLQYLSELPVPVSALEEAYIVEEEEEDKLSQGWDFEDEGSQGVLS